MLCFPDCCKVLQGDPRVVGSTLMILISALRYTQVHPKCCTLPQGDPKRMTNAPMILLIQALEIAVTLKAGRNALQVSATLLRLMHLTLHSTPSQTLLEASSD